MSKYQIISVQASAGSGKTYNLVKRYLSLLMESDDTGIRNITAITFTNKTAVEMKRRIINYLKKAALFLDTGDFFDGLNLTKNEIARKSIVVLKEILDSYDNFNVSTIDSFKNRVLKSCAISVGLSPNFTIERDYSKNLLFSLDLFLQKAQIDKKFKEIALRYASQYLMKDSGWAPKNDIYNGIKKVFDKSGNVGRNIATGSEVDFRGKFSSKTKIIMDKIKQFSELLPEIDVNFQHGKAVEKILKEGVKAFSSFNIPARFAREILEYKKGAKTSFKADELWRKINKKIKSLCDFYMENYYSVYCDIYSQVALEFDKQSKKERVVFLNEINKKTMDFFEKNDNVMPEVYYRLSEKYKHFLIDEFQDTNLIQWTGIKRFLEESLACGGTFFYVGDVKQAIYAFRGGHPEIFNAISEEFPFATVEKTILKQNFRSDKNIVDFNNDIFSKGNIERFFKEVYGGDKDVECDFTKFTDTYSCSGQIVSKERSYGYVEIDIIDKDCENEKEETRRKLTDCVVQLVNRFNSEDIAVLCRTNDEIVAVGSWLLEKGFEVESSQTLNIKNNSIIKQIVSLLKFINSPINALSFASFILGDIFGKVANIKRDELEKFIFDCNKENKNGILYKAFRNEYGTLWDGYLKEFFVKAGFAPVYELTLEVLEKFKIINNFPTSKAFVMRFLEEIKEFETQDSGLKIFLEYFDELENDVCIKTSFGTGIKIMTVHKAKGLQFPAVIVPFLKLSAKALGNPYFEDSNEQIKLLSVSKNIARFSKKAKEIYDKEMAYSLLSELNILYVSMTRAQHELYAIVPAKSGVSNNVAEALFKGRSLIAGVKVELPADNDIKDDFITDVLSDGYKAMREYPSNADKTTLDNKSRIKGSILHFALSKIISLKGGDINENIDYAIKSAKRKFFSEEIEFIGEKLKILLSHEKILNLFIHDNIYNEKEIVNAFGETFRVDKLIVGDNEVTAVDFKSCYYNKDEKQIKNYKTLLSEIYTNKKVLAYVVDIEKIAILPI